MHKRQAETGAKSAAPALRKIYNENPGDNRYSLVRCLKTLGDNEPFNAEFKRLSTQALESEDQNKRTEAIRSLTYFAKSEAKGIFEQLQKDPNKRVRDYAVAGFDFFVSKGIRAHMGIRDQRGIRAPGEFELCGEFGIRKGIRNSNSPNSNSNSLFPGEKEFELTGQL